MCWQWETVAGTACKVLEAWVGSCECWIRHLSSGSTWPAGNLVGQAQGALPPQREGPGLPTAQGLSDLAAAHPQAIGEEW